jgi:GT2 family glycosyltransferase
VGAPSPKIVAVIPVHNRVDQTLRCLRSLAAGTVAPAVVVVDDGSRDGTPEQVRREFPAAVILTADGNRWWAGATNIGVEYALAHEADFVLTVNNDGVLHPRAVEALLDSERSRPRSLLVSQRHDLADPERCWSAGVVFDWHRRFPLCAAPVGGSEPFPVDASGANSMLVPRSCFDEIGLFDAGGLPQNWADYDLQLRAKAAGWRVFSVPSSIVYVDLSTTGPRLAATTRLSDAVRLVAAFRSPYYPPHLWRFFRRHAPASRFPVVVLYRYLAVAASVARHYRIPYRRR